MNESLSVSQILSQGQIPNKKITKWESRDVLIDFQKKYMQFSTSS